MNKRKYSEGLKIILPNGVIFEFIPPDCTTYIENYDLIVNNGKDNRFYKVGTIKDIDAIGKILFEESEDE